ncbi:remorin-like isoform X1 [Cynara cardunculus var. scolymus]|uniref:Remorin, C-terminal n=1 Tax=Cynara cardunculus var. scolymus TaxID=59895 RepID=A0A103XG92_CYNCS|nr:remorin-like isoform X1 [Cynara cardunculus var. scolymus]KVH90107.1 Remorin, C-terminal [Cynara cardunculus var. scolymus]
MGEEKEESKKDIASTETESKSTPPPPEPKSTSVAAEPPEKLKPVHGGDDAGLEIVVTEKRMALIKAWEENEKTKADNKAYTKVLAIGAWENSKRAEVEANLKKIEVDIENEKVKQREIMKMKMATVQKEAEEKRAAIEAKKGQDIINAEQLAAKFHATGTLPSKLFKCFGY